jgi:hypothetical protein
MKFSKWILGIVLLMHGIAKADVLIAVDLDPSRDGIQQTRLFDENEIFDVEVVMTLTDATSVAAYTFDLRFDTDELDYVSRVDLPDAPFEVFYVPDPEDPNDDGMPFEENAGTDDPILGTGPYGFVGLINGIALDGDGLPIDGPDSGSYVLTRITFQAVAAGTVHIDTDFSVFVGGDINGFTDNNFDLLPASSIVSVKANAMDESVRGDANGNGVLTFGDIGLFVVALQDRIAYALQKPEIDPDIILDMNDSGQLTFGDIGGFVAKLQGN